MIPHFTDRSRTETGNLCPRMRYWNYVYGGTGLVPAGDGIHLLFGQAIHSMLEGDMPKSQGYMDSIAALELAPTPDGHPQRLEWGSLYTGLVETYKRFVLPKILDEYIWISSEEEITIDLGSGISWMTRLDGTLQRKADGKYFVLEAKTSSWPEKLLEGAATNFQLLMELEALRRHLPAGSEIGGALFLVFNKGKKQRATPKEREEGHDGHRRVSPFTYWYGLQHANFTEYRLGYAPNYKKLPVWLIPDWYEIAVANWEQDIAGQVQVWPSVDFDPIRTESVIRQVRAREARLREGFVFSRNSANLADDYYPQNFARCNDCMGEECAFKAACYSPRVARDPLGSGLYERRVPNHPQEIVKPW